MSGKKDIYISPLPKRTPLLILVGQLSDILRKSPAPICAAISISYLKSCEECFVVKVNLVGEKKSLLWDLCLSRYKGKRTLMIHFNNVFFLLSPAAMSGEQGERMPGGAWPLTV